MNTTILTRNDDKFDSIAWAFEVHVKQADNPIIIMAILYGNEDAPFKIEFFDKDHYKAAPRMVWVSDD